MRNTASFEGCEAVRETADALLVNIEGTEVWIPKSHVDDDSEVYAKGHEGRLVISEWIAMEKGLI